MTRKALARRIAEPYLTSQQRREAPAPPQPEGLRGFWPGALSLVSQRPQRVFSFLAPRTQPKFAAALLYEPQTWCTRSLKLAVGPLPLDSDNFLKGSPEVFRNPPFWIVGFRLAEVRDVTDVIAFSILVDVLVVHLLSGNLSD
jgi:hypothetical protein